MSPLHLKYVTCYLFICLCHVFKLILQLYTLMYVTVLCGYLVAWYILHVIGINKFIIYVTCELSDMTMLNTSINAICANYIIIILLGSQGLTPAYDNTPVKFSIYLCKHFLLNIFIYSSSCVAIQSNNYGIITHFLSGYFKYSIFWFNMIYTVDLG